MASNFVQVPPNSTGLKFDTNELVVNSNTVERQNICIADPTAPTSVASIVAGTFPTQGYLSTASAPLDSYKATYAAAFVAQSAGTSATTDIFTLFGSATTTVRIQQIALSGTAATAAAYFDVLLQMCSTAPTSGTASTLTNTPFDSSDPAGTAVAKFWTAAPSAATYVGKIAVAKLFAPITGTPALTPPPIVFNFGAPHSNRSLVLRGVAQGVSISFNAATPANATSLDGWVVWTEE